MKKIDIVLFSVFLVIGGALLLFPLNDNFLDKNEAIKPKIAFIRMKEGDQFWSTMRNGARNARTDTDCTVEFYSGVKASDVASQWEFIYKAIHANPDCIIITPCDYYLMKMPLQSAQAAGIKIIQLFNETDPNLGIRHSFMTNLEPAGSAIGQFILKKGKTTTINIVIASTSATISSQNYMEKGIRDVFEYNDSIQCTTIYTGSHPESVSNQIAEYIDKNPATNIIIGLDNGISEGIIKTLQKNGKKENTLFIATTHSLTNIESLENGTADAILVINSFAMGYQSIYAALDLLEGNKIQNAPVNYALVTKENMFDSDVQRIVFPLM